MPKSRKQKSNAHKNKVASNKGATNSSIDKSKRNTLTTFRNSALGLAVVGGAGAYFYGAYQKDLEERDLTKIGRGKPAVVQIHDPGCQLCATLQSETRKAVSNFEAEEVNFLVANVRTQKGREFANKYNVPHVTLLLFNKRGKLENILQGVRREEELTNIIGSLIAKS